MKIICVAKNYREHVQEMGGAAPDRPVFFIKPQSALYTGNRMSYPIPEFTQELDYECEVVLKIVHEGKNIPVEKAMSHVGEITVGIDFTARDLQRMLKKNSFPWEISKAFDGAAMTGSWIPLSEWNQDEKGGSFHLNINGKTVQSGHIGQMVFPFEKLISEASRYFTLQSGDLLFTGTPQGVGQAHPGDELEVFLDDRMLLEMTMAR